MAKKRIIQVFGRFHFFTDKLTSPHFSFATNEKDNMSQRSGVSATFPLLSLLFIDDKKCAEALISEARKAILRTTYADGERIGDSCLGANLFCETILDVTWNRSRGSVERFMADVNAGITMVKDDLYHPDRGAKFAVAHPYSVLLAGKMSDPTMCFDFDGVGGLMMASNSCGCSARHDVVCIGTRRAMSKERITCSCITFATPEACVGLYIPEQCRKDFLSWFSQVIYDSRREGRINVLFGPPSYGGMSVSNIIGSGFEGGFHNDRRKRKKRKKADACGQNPQQQQQQQKAQAEDSMIELFGVDTTGGGGGGRPKKRRKFPEAKGEVGPQGMVPSDDGAAAPADEGEEMEEGGAKRPAGMDNKVTRPGARKLIPEYLREAIMGINSANRDIPQSTLASMMLKTADAADGQDCPLITRDLLYATRSVWFNGASIAPPSGCLESALGIDGAPPSSSSRSSNLHQAPIASVEIPTFDKRDRTGAARRFPQPPPQRHHRESEVISAAMSTRNRWVDAAMIKKCGSPWASGGGMPCGCIAAFMYLIVTSTRMGMAKRDCRILEADASGRANGVDGLEPEKGLSRWATAALLVDITCGACTAGVASSKKTRAAMSTNRETFILGPANVMRDMRALSRLCGASGEAQQKQNKNIDKLLRWASSVSLAKEELACWASGCLRASAARDDGGGGGGRRRPMPPRPTQAWYFSPSKRVTSLCGAADLAMEADMYTRAEEIACAWTARSAQGKGWGVGRGAQKPSAMRCIIDDDDECEHRMSNTEKEALARSFSIVDSKPSRAPTMPDGNGGAVAISMSDESDTSPVGWPCDAAWGMALAGPRMGLSGIGCGHAMPLAGRSSIIVFDGEQCVADMTLACDRNCRCGSDGSDALVCGTMCCVMEAGIGGVADCALLYPFAFVCLTCLERARKREEAWWMSGGKSAVSSPLPVTPSHSIQSSTRWGWIGATRLAEEIVGWGYDELLSAAISWLVDRCEAVLRQSDAAPPLPLAARNAGIPKPGEFGFDACRSIGKICCSVIGGTKCGIIDERILATGLSCIAQLKRRWIMKRSNAVQMAAQCRGGIGTAASERLRAHLEATADGGSPEAPFDSGLDDVDRGTRTFMNMVLVCAAAESEGFAIALISGVRVFDGDCMDCPEELTAAKAYDSVAAYTSLVDGLREISINPRDPRDSRGALGGCGVEHKRSGMNERIPSLSCIASTVIDSIEEAEACGEMDVIDDTLRFLRGIESAAGGGGGGRTTPAVSKKFIGAKQLAQGYSDGWKSRGIPLFEMGCTGKLCLSSEWTAVADHPLSNPSVTPIECGGGCGKSTLPRADLWIEAVPHSAFMPAKDTLMMSELIHARNGMVVFQHASKQAASDGSSRASQTHSYATSLIKCMTRYDREEATDSAVDSAISRDPDLFTMRSANTSSILAKLL
jgi:hypothetical protein